MPQILRERRRWRISGERRDKQSTGGMFVICAWLVRIEGDNKNTARFKYCVVDPQLPMQRRWTSRRTCMTQRHSSTARLSQARGTVSSRLQSFASQSVRYESQSNSKSNTMKERATLTRFRRARVLLDMVAVEPLFGSTKYSHVVERSPLAAVAGSAPPSSSLSTHSLQAACTVRRVQRAQRCCSAAWQTRQEMVLGHQRVWW
ncbi:hypothetical protein FA95DRAFT_1309999 [Auriscalpium vulgare]|uniref:Uncharacterized protein n=1 Tax=Auriscalpium vulgare TaxID=40419 RepID=A0ACB8RRL3_9AGAM|nr:hypothetical protein FA95DRAFT_1309999 [Auriscalpium vulgare]